MNIPINREFDILLAGRAGIDFNTTNLNCSFADIKSYTKSVGGSPANIVQGAARLGLKTGFIGKVSGDGMGDYIIKTFIEQGINIDGIVKDNTGARNCLAITEIKSPLESGSYLYRENAADLLLNASEIDENYIKRSKAVLISGTAFSKEPSREAMFKIMEYAKKHGTLIMLDIDYRAVGWSSKEETAIYYNEAAKKCDLILGNREEFDAVEYLSMPQNRDNEKSAKAFLKEGVQLVIVKDGSKGSWAYTSDGKVVQQDVIPTKINKTYGSGDAYAAGFLYGIFRGMTIKESMEIGTACASIVLRGISCADAMPTLLEVHEYLENYKKTGSGSL